MRPFCLVAAVACLSHFGVALADDTMPVSVVRSIRASIAEEVKLTGNLEARRVSRLSAEVDGIVEELKVDDGDRLSRGQVVVTLNSELASIAKSRAAAETSESKAQLAEAKRQFAELTELAKTQHVPRTNVEAARAAISITEATLAQTRAEGLRVDALLRRHIVRAPFDGVVNNKFVEVGQWVDTTSPLIELVETRFLRLEAAVPQVYFSRVKPGTKVAIRFDALPQEIFEAAVTATIPVSDSAARTFPVRIDLGNEQGLLAPGMSARVTLQIEDEANPTALIVPRDAVVRRPDGTESIWTIEIEDGITKAARREIRTGRTYHNNVEIVSGDIEPGAQVVVRGNEILRPGQPVHVTEDSPMDI